MRRPRAGCYAGDATMAEPSVPANSEDRFQRQLTVATLGLLFVVLVIYLLQQFAVIVQPLLIAILSAYVLLPVHRWLVRRGIRPRLAYIVILILLLAILVGVGEAAYSSVTSITPEKLDAYGARIEGLVDRAARLTGLGGPQAARDRLKQLAEVNKVSAQDIIRNLKGVVGSFFGFLTFALIVFVYLIFLVAENVTFPQRLALAFGEARAGHLADVLQHINEAIAGYIAVKTWISFVTAALSLAVFLVFGIDFAFLWAILVFLLNYIPYIGGLIALAPPIVLSFLQFDDFWHGLAVTALLIGVQLFTGQYLEPRLAGRKLNLSPILILLALAFWGSLWGIAGMVLAVPLTVVCKIILDAVPETRPLGTLMSNVGDAPRQASAGKSNAPSTPQRSSA
jgi:predicted PurR-regulated permease PerM